MSSSVCGASWHRLRIPPAVAAVVCVVGGSTRRGPRLAPQLRGHVDRRVVDALERRGWHVHRVGAAAYIHHADEHLILGVWRRRATPPAWARRLGRASAGYVRRLERVTREQRWRRQARDLAGRFGIVRPWTAWPTPSLYRWDPVGPSVAAQADALELASRRRWLASFPAEATEVELRARDGDR